VTLASWAWTSRADLDPAAERTDVWVNPRLPPAVVRAEHPLRVEISVIEDFAQALRYLEHFFARDSVLVAVVRLDDECRFLMYTSLSEPAAYERWRELRETFRPTSIGWSVAMEPGWGALVALMECEATSGAWFESQHDVPGGAR
jgi:hypothetical protein